VSSSNLSLVDGTKGAGSSWFGSIVHQTVAGATKAAQSVRSFFSERRQRDARVKSWSEYTIKERAKICCSSLIVYVPGLVAHFAIAHGHEQGAFSSLAAIAMASSLGVAIGFGQAGIIYSTRQKNKEDSGHQV
jgi:hypothetical protein